MDENEAIRTAIEALKYAGGMFGSPPASRDCAEAIGVLNVMSVEAKDGEKTGEEKS